MVTMKLVYLDGTAHDTWTMLTRWQFSYLQVVLDEVQDNCTCPHGKNKAHCVQFHCQLVTGAACINSVEFTSDWFRASKNRQASIACSVLYCVFMDFKNWRCSIKMRTCL